ncbi:probable pilin-like protein [Crocosphaera subtropica ATCC 51142]|uniref:Probable pilin-like protein n=1 Tax=Crocosphaera subtropica (strain ATCC 51142 / BH68) TaxID=43989 RepID=B1X0V8_CROS5|nr:type II secretion system protein [Crocosphaera subtropica]ACB52997.1 probable pilin-like protein [Crocosphaera subtropica ATCC 51142]
MLSAVSNPNQGVTLLEIIIAAVITGILAAIGIPSLMGMLQGDQVKQGVDQIQLALQDAQKQAIRNSKQCTIIIDKTATPPTIDIKDPHLPNNQGCLGSVERTLPNNVVMTGNFTNNEVSFSFKGNTTTMGTIVVKPAKGGGEKRCLVMGLGLGLMRTGIYDSSASDNPPSATNCKKVTDS